MPKRSRLFFRNSSNGLGPPSGRGPRLPAARAPGVARPAALAAGAAVAAAGPPGAASIVAQHGAEASAPPENSSHDAVIGSGLSGKTVPSRDALPIGGAMSDETERLEAALAGLDGLDGRVAMARVKDGVATVMLDATGLSAEQRAGLERQVRAATVALPGVDRNPRRDDRREGRSARSSRSAAARAGSANPPSPPTSPSRWRGWARRSA